MGAGRPAPVGVGASVAALSGSHDHGAATAVEHRDPPAGADVARTGVAAGRDARMTALGAARFAYVGSYTSTQRNGRGDGIRVYRMDPGS